jgi:hypothetical protein
MRLKLRLVPAVVLLVGQVAGAQPTCVPSKPSTRETRAVVAIPKVKRLVAENPGDPNYLKMYWQVLRASNHLSEAMRAGEAYALIDTSVADSAYLDRQIFDAAAACQLAAAMRFALVGVARYPSRADYLIHARRFASRAGVSEEVVNRNYAGRTDSLLAEVDLSNWDFDAALQRIDMFAKEPAFAGAASQMRLRAMQARRLYADSVRVRDIVDSIASIPSAADVEKHYQKAKASVDTVLSWYAAHSKSEKCQDWQTALELVEYVHSSGNLTWLTDSQSKELYSKLGSVFDVALQRIKTYCPPR